MWHIVGPVWATNAMHPAHAQSLAELFRSHGMSCRVVHISNIEKYKPQCLWHMKEIN
jgi:hypothetical protein